MTSINTNVNDYTLSELMAIVEVEELTPEQIIENTNYYIRKYKTKNPTLAVFFKEIQSQLLQYVDGLDPENDENEENDDSEPKIIVKPNSYSMEPAVEGYTNMSNDAIYSSGDKMVNEWYKNQSLLNQIKPKLTK